MKTICNTNSDAPFCYKLINQRERNTQNDWWPLFFHSPANGEDKVFFGTYEAVEAGASSNRFSGIFINIVISILIGKMGIDAIKKISGPGWHTGSYHGQSWRWSSQQGTYINVYSNCKSPKQFLLRWCAGIIRTGRATAKWQRGV